MRGDKAREVEYVHVVLDCHLGEEEYETVFQQRYLDTVMIEVNDSAAQLGQWSITMITNISQGLEFIRLW